MKTAYHKYLTLVFILSFTCLLSFSQSNISFRITTVTCFPTESDNLHIFKNNLDKAGHIALEPGGVLSYEAFIMEDKVSFKFSQGFFYDVAGKPGGFTHLGIRFKILQKFKHSLNLGFGPTLHFRKDWSTIPGYVTEEIYERDIGFQWVLSRISGGIEYNYIHTKRGDYSVSLFHNRRKGFALLFGYRYWFSKDIKHRKCDDCPGF